MEELFLIYKVVIVFVYQREESFGDQAWKLWELEVKHSYFFEREAGEKAFCNQLVVAVSPQQVIEDLFKVRIKDLFHEGRIPQRVFFLKF